MKSPGLNFKEGNKTKVYINKDGTMKFEPCKNADIFKRFFSQLGTSLVKKLSIASNAFNSITTKDYYTGISNNKRNYFQLSNTFQDVF